MGVHRKAELRAQVIGEGRARRAVHTERLTMAVFDFEGGPYERPDPPHSHPHDQVSYLVSGRLRFFLGDEQADLEPGDMVTIPGGVPHAIQLLSPSARVVDAFHPVREDFLAR